MGPDFSLPVVKMTRKGRLNQLAFVLLILAAIVYVGLSLVQIRGRGHDPTVWWRGSTGLLGGDITIRIR